MGKGQKRKQTVNEPPPQPPTEPPVAPALELVPESSSSTASEVSHDPVDRLADIMSNLLETKNKTPIFGTAKGEVVPTFNPEDKEQNSEVWLNKIEELRQIFNWSEQATI